MGPLNKPLPFSARIFDGLNHQVTVHRSKDGSPLKAASNRRPEGVSGRQRKIARRNARKALKAHGKQVAGFFAMGQPSK